MAKDDAKEHFKSLSAIRLQPQGALYDVQHTDLIIISSVLDLDKTLKYGAKRTAGLKISTSFLPLLQYSNSPTLRN
jgi:hypothetical protein